MGLRLNAEVGLDGSGFEAGLKRLEHVAGHGLGEIKSAAMAAFGVYGIEQAIHKTIEYGEHLVDTSRRIGVSIEALQEFGHAARMNGADLDSLTGFIEKLNAARLDPKKQAAFEKLGISKEDQRKPVEELLMEISANVRGRSSQEIVGPIRQLGGKGAGSLIPMLKDDMEELREEARKLGVVMKTDDAVMLKFLADEMKVLGQVIITGLAPAIIFAMQMFLQFTNRLKAAGSFWGTFAVDSTKNNSGFSKLWKGLTGQAGGAKTADEIHQAEKEIAAAFVASGAASDSELTGLTDSTKKMIEALLKKQKDIENINQIPEFEDPEAKKKHGPKLRDFTDNLTRSGNFLGSSQDVLQTIGREHTSLLRKIEHNTRSKTGVTADTGNSNSLDSVDENFTD